jgi:hypothetical protein
MTTVTFTLTDSVTTEGLVDMNWDTEGPEPTLATVLAARILDFVRELSAANTPLALPAVTDVEPKQ